jgi:hypothetical protein
MVKICHTGLLKLNFETFFLANFQILGPLGCQRWVAIPQNVKKVKITAPYKCTSTCTMYMYLYS